MKNICLLSLLVVVIFASSCGKHRYLQVDKKAAIQEIYSKSLEEYRLQINDMLYIKVLTDNEKFFNLFNPNVSQQQNVNVSDAYFYISGYPVDIAGDIELPEIGKVHVAGLTVNEIEKSIQEKVSKIVFDAQITVRLVSFKVSVLGEVKTPGEYTIYRDRATILDVLARAGDMNYFGKRKEVMIYRSTEKGIIPYTINLTDRNALSSPIFYLQPNDVVYVQPLPRTIFRVNTTDMMTYLSVISTSITLVIAIITLSK